MTEICLKLTCDKFSDILYNDMITQKMVATKKDLLFVLKYLSQ